jgi:hypothetical protein
MLMVNDKRPARKLAGEVPAKPGQVKAKRGFATLFLCEVEARCPHGSFDWWERCRPDTVQGEELVSREFGEVFEGFDAGIVQRACGGAAELGEVGHR